MKLIVEQKNGSVFVYTESEKQYRATQPGRETPRLNPKVLEQECNIVGLGDFHMVFNLCR
jgi:hypothetical protein